MAKLTTKQYTTTEKLIFSCGVIALLVTGYSFMSVHKTKFNFSKGESSQINYEMAKLQTAESLYSLEDREIEKNYKALVAAKAKVAAVVSTKKAITDKTKAAATAAKQAEVAKAIAAQKAQAVHNSPKPRAFDFSQATKEVSTENKEAQSNTPQQSAAFQNVAQVPAITPTPSETPKKSYEEWRNEIFTAQNKDAVLKLSNAFKKNEVTSEDFQKLVTEMLNSKDEKIIGLGLYALRATPSYTSYVHLVKVQPTLSASFSAYVQEALNGYNQSAGLAILKQSLSSSETIVIKKTLEIIKAGLNSIQNGTTSELVDGRNRRSDLVGFSVSNYSSFMPLLQNIATNSNDPALIALANQNMNMIDPLYVASN